MMSITIPIITTSSIGVMTGADVISGTGLTIEISSEFRLDTDIPSGVAVTTDMLFEVGSVVDFPSGVELAYDVLSGVWFTIVLSEVGFKTDILSEIELTSEMPSEDIGLTAKIPSEVAFATDAPSKEELTTDTDILPGIALTCDIV